MLPTGKIRQIKAAEEVVVAAYSCRVFRQGSRSAAEGEQHHPLRRVWSMPFSFSSPGCKRAFAVCRRLVSKAAYDDPQTPGRVHRLPAGRDSSASRTPRLHGRASGWMPGVPEDE